MGGSSHSKSAPAPPPPPKILVPYPFDFPPAAARTWMSVPAYDLMFGKLSLSNLFDGHFLQPGWNAGITFKPPQKDPHVDLTATISKNGGDALLRWQRDLDDPHTFVDLLASTSKPGLRLRSCAYYPKYGIGAFGAFPLLMENRACSDDYGVMGLRYISENLSIGASFVPFPSSSEIPYGAWLVGRKGNLSVGLQYKPLMEPCVSEKEIPSKENYRLGGDHITGSTLYVDFGLEMATRMDKDKPTDNADKSSVHIAASLQLNTHLLVKGKLGPSNSSVALAFKLPPFFTLSVTADNDHSKGTRSYGFGIHVEDNLFNSYQTVDRDKKVLTETTESFEGETEKRTFPFDYDSDDFDNLPTCLKPIDKIV